MANERGATTLTFGSQEKLKKAGDDHILVQAERVKRGEPRQNFLNYVLAAIDSYRDSYLKRKKT